MFTVPVSISFAAELPDAGRLLKESSLPPSLAPQHPPPDLPQQVKPLEPKKSDTKINVSSFTFTGNTIFSRDELSDIMAGYRNKELTLSELEIAIATVTNAYRKRGYFLASPFIPPQTVAPGGTLIIEVQEGVLEEIHVETTTAKTRTLKSVLEYYANQVPVNLPLDDGTLTAMVMRTNELPQYHLPHYAGAGLKTRHNKGDPASQRRQALQFFTEHR